MGRPIFRRLSCKSYFATPCFSYCRTGKAALSSSQYRRRPCHHHVHLSFFSDWTARGHDMTAEMLSFGGAEDRPPKMILQGYAPTGFDVANTIKKVDDSEESSEQGTVHMNGSIVVFPYSCFLWNFGEKVTMESIVPPVLLHKPTLEYLFIGHNHYPGDKKSKIETTELDRIKQALLPQNIVVEKLDLANAMGTFNILNAEDRRVAVALIMDTTE